jgi:hypothetical protein
MLGLTEDEYSYFMAEVRARYKEQPAPYVEAGLETLVIISLAATLISFGLTIAASFFKPKPSEPPRLNARNLQGDTVNNIRRYAPRYGFDAQQDIIQLGDTIPLIFAKRELINGTYYGGIRVNTSLLWSQLWSLGGSQLLRAIFLLAEGEVESIDINGFAIGNNSIGSYDLASSAANQSGSRITVYFKPNGGRITGNDRIAGRSSLADPANAENAGAVDVFELNSLNGSYAPDFSYATKPSTQTSFGLYSPIGNNLGMRINPVVRPTYQAQLKKKNDNGDATVVCVKDITADAIREKYKSFFSSRSGLIAGSVSNVGDSCTYRLDKSTDAETTYTSSYDGETHNEKCADVAATVSGRQRTWDDAITVGDMYRVGSALAVCTARNPGDDIFNSDADFLPLGGGTSVEATFTVVRAGQSDFTTTAILNANGKSGTARKSATNGSHIFKIAIGNVSTMRACRILEIGIRSSLGIRISGLCNFRDTLTFDETDGKACLYKQGNTVSSGQVLSVQQYGSGTMSASEDRYSFFRLYYRESGTDQQFTMLPQCFGIRSITQQSVFNYLRIQMPESRRWEFRFEPLSGWEIRNNIAVGNLEILDSRITTLRTVDDGNGIFITFNGEQVARSIETFKLASVERATSMGLPYTDGTSYVDAWGKLAETFMYEEVGSSAAGNPEHEIVYVNEIAQNPVAPSYDNLAILGINARSALEWQNFSQFSAYVTGGIKVRRLTENDTLGASHLFPDVLRDLLLSTRYGSGDAITEDQIDTDAFRTCATWCQSRRYFFDGALVGRQNLRVWAADVAAYSLLEFTIKDGKFSLKPALSFPDEGAVPIRALFTAGNIVQDSFRLEYMDEADRLPIQASIKWREERASTDPANPGLFPVEREFLLREATGSTSDTIESYDLSDYVTNKAQALDFGKYVLRMRRIITHSIKFQTTPDGIVAGLAPGDYIRVAMDVTHYDEFNNGIVTSDGVLVSTNPLSNGTYDVVSWSKGSVPPEDTQLIVNNGFATPKGVIFAVKRTDLQVRTYKVESLSLTENGSIDIEAVHFPTEPNGTLTLTKDWDTESAWVISE